MNDLLSRIGQKLKKFLNISKPFLDSLQATLDRFLLSQHLAMFRNFRAVHVTKSVKNAAGAIFFFFVLETFTEICSHFPGIFVSRNCLCIKTNILGAERLSERGIPICVSRREILPTVKVNIKFGRFFKRDK